VLDVLRHHVERTVPDGAWVRVGAYALVVDGERILLVRGAASSDDAGRWWLPGGGLEFGEDPAAAVLRELLEETGLEGRIDGLVEAFSTIYATTEDRPGVPLHMVGIVYRVSVAGGTLRDEVEGSTDACAWVDREEAAALPLSPGARPASRWPGPDPAECARRSGRRRRAARARLPARA
jgi:ADP-ribose pyrophosphatase YjhB (NUDIX family)